MKYQIRVQNPSGETKKFKLKMGPCPILLGREQEAEIQLSDATLPSQAASLHTNEGRDQDVFPFHLKLTPETLKPARLGDLFVREALIPIDVPFTLGESTLTLEKIRSDIRSLPTQPEKLTHWQTCSASGADLIWMTKKASATPL